MAAITETSLGLPLFSKGKVRDTYALDGSLLMVATDRVSAFDVVFNEGIPHKGEVLCNLSAYWFQRTAHIVPNHYISIDLPREHNLPDYLDGRSMIVKKAEPIKLEAVVRGYITGSAHKEYAEKGSVCGIELPEGLKNGDKLPELIFTPATKAETGHDINITEMVASDMVGADGYAFMKGKALEIYNFAHEELRKRGFILADTKMEFGKYEGEIILIDELLTPDSSRYWDRAAYDEGKLVSFDKQYLRDYLGTLEWNREPPPPHLPKELIDNLSKKYLDAYERITGTPLLQP